MNYAEDDFRRWAFTKWASDRDLVTYIDSGATHVDVGENHSIIDSTVYDEGVAPILEDHGHEPPLDPDEYGELLTDDVLGAISDRLNDRSTDGHRREITLETYWQDL